MKQRLESVIGSQEKVDALGEAIGATRDDELWTPPEPEPPALPGLVRTHYFVCEAAGLVNPTAVQLRTSFVNNQYQLPAFNDPPAEGIQASPVNNRYLRFPQPGFWTVVLATLIPGLAGAERVRLLISDEAMSGQPVASVDTGVGDNIDQNDQGQFFVEDPAEMGNELAIGLSNPAGKTITAYLYFQRFEVA